MPPQILPSQESPGSVGCDVLVVGAFSTNQGPELSAAAAALDGTFDGALSESLDTAGFKGKVGEVALLPTMRRIPAKVVAVAGLGPRDRAGPNQVRRAAG